MLESRDAVSLENQGFRHSLCLTPGRQNMPLACLLVFSSSRPCSPTLCALVTLVTHMHTQFPRSVVGEDHHPDEEKEEVVVGWQEKLFSQVRDSSYLFPPVLPRGSCHAPFVYPVRPSEVSSLPWSM